MYVIERCRSYFPNEEFLSWGLGGSDHSRVEANVSRFAIEFRREAGGQQCQLLGIEPRRIERITLWNGLAPVRKTQTGDTAVETRQIQSQKVGLPRIARQTDKGVCRRYQNFPAIRKSASLGSDSGLWRRFGNWIFAVEPVGALYSGRSSRCRLGIFDKPVCSASS